MLEEVTWYVLTRTAARCARARAARRARAIRAIPAGAARRARAAGTVRRVRAAARRVCAVRPPASAADAVAMARAGLASLARMDAAGLTAAEQADCLRALEQAEAAHTAARARVLAAFHAGGGFEDDGHGSAKSWLRWQTRITTNAAAAAMAWMRRLARTPPSPARWRRVTCRRRGPGRSAGGRTCCPRSTGRARTRSCWPPPPAARTSPDLAALAEEIRRRTARPDTRR